MVLLGFLTPIVNQMSICSWFPLSWACYAYLSDIYVCFEDLYIYNLINHENLAGYRVQRFVLTMLYVSPFYFLVHFSTSYTFSQVSKEWQMRLKKHWKRQKHLRRFLIFRFWPALILTWCFCPSVSCISHSAPFDPPWSILVLWCILTAFTSFLFSFLPGRNLLQIPPSILLLMCAL